SVSSQAARARRRVARYHKERRAACGVIPCVDAETPRRYHRSVEQLRWCDEHRRQTMKGFVVNFTLCTPKTPDRIHPQRARRLLSACPYGRAVTRAALGCQRLLWHHGGYRLAWGNACEGRCV